MAVIRLCRGKAPGQRRSGGRTILISTAALLVCLIGLAGCGSSSNNNAGVNSGNNIGSGSPGSGSPGSGSPGSGSPGSGSPGSGSPGSGSPGSGSGSPGSGSPGSGSGSPGSGSPGSGSGSPGCFTSAFVHPGPKSPKAPKTVLAAAQLPSPVIPDPDVYIDSERQADENQQDWANKGIDNARSVIAEYQQQGNLGPTEQHLQTESKVVVAQEDSTLFKEDLDALGSDPSFSDQICSALSSLESNVTSYTTALDHLNKALTYLNSIEFTNGTQAPSTLVPKDLANVIQDTYNEFQQTIGSCMDTLDTTQWIIQQIQKLFCPAGLSRKPQKTTLPLRWRRPIMSPIAFMTTATRRWERLSAATAA